MTRPLRRPRRLAAAGFMLSAAALLAMTTLLSKLLTQSPNGDALHPMQVAAGRYGFALVAVLPVAAWSRPRVVVAAWPTHAGRTLFGWLGVTCLFAAAALMPLAEATAISFMSPVAAMLFALVCFDDRPGPSRWLAVGVALAGALMLLRPGTAAFQPAALVAFASALFAGAEAIFMKRLSGREPILRIMLIDNALGLPLALLFAASVWVVPSGPQWALLAGLGAAMAASQACVFAALRRARASFVMPFFYTTLAFAALYDLLVFDVRPSFLGVVGALTIVGGLLLFAVDEAGGSAGR